MATVSLYDHAHFLVIVSSATEVASKGASFLQYLVVVEETQITASVPLWFSYLCFSLRSSFYRERKSICYLLQLLGKLLLKAIVSYPIKPCYLLIAQFLHHVSHQIRPIKKKKKEGDPYLKDKHSVARIFWIPIDTGI